MQDILDLEMNCIKNIDCMEGMRQFPNKCIDLVVTDIPYGVVNRGDNGLRSLNKGNADVLTFEVTDLIHELCRITKGSMYIFCGTEQVSEIRKKMIGVGMSTRLCIWEKTNPSPMNGQHMWLSGVECCIYGKFKGAVFNEHCKNTVFRYPCGRNKIHPTQKPLALIKRFVLASSNEGDLILDPFMGSGTTAIACLEENRNFLGFEIDDLYFKKAVERIENLQLSDKANN